MVTMLLQPKHKSLLTVKALSVLLGVWLEDLSSKVEHVVILLLLKLYLMPHYEGTLVAPASEFPL